MRFVLMGFFFVISLVLESTLFSRLVVAGVKPDLILVLVVLYAMLHGSREGAVVGFMGGIMQDLLLGRFIGLNALAKLLTGLLFGILEYKIYKESIIIAAAALIFGTLWHESVIWVLGLFAGFSANYFTALKDIIFPSVVYNSCLAPFIYGRFYRSSQKGLLKKP
ncbi:MAG: rod shape-determining protein MreD [Bacillota bacterium]